MIIDNLQNYIELMRLNKPIGTLLLLWPTMVAVLLANHGYPSAGIVFIFLWGVFIVRAAGCVVNDIIDRDLDKRVARTKNRPITSGKVSVKAAGVLVGILLLLALILVLFLNRATFLMACCAVVMTAVYPFFKRFTYFPQVWLGIVFNWGVLMAFTAVNGRIPMAGYLLYIASVLLTIAYDTLYGITDQADDLKIGIKSTAILFGKYDYKIIGFLQAIAIVLLLTTGLILQLNFWYYLGLLSMMVLFFYQHLLIKDRQPERCFQAFMNNNYSWLVIFIGVLLSYL